MLTRTRPCVLAGIGALALVAGGCDDDNPVTPAGPGSLVIQFDNMVGASALQLNTQAYANAAGNQYAVTKLEYVVSHVHLHPPTVLRDHAEGDFEADIVHYRNEADAATRSLAIPDVPSGEYAELEFTFGIDGAENVAGAYPALDLLGMAWPAPMGGGYHYMRCEGDWGPGAVNSFTTHTGPSGGTDYSVAVSLDGAIVIEEGKTTTVRVTMDVNEWYTTPHPYDFADYGAIMGNATAQQYLSENGADAFGIAQITTE